MADSVEKAKDVADAATHPVETTKDLAAEAAAGRSARTPAIAITGVTLVLGAFLALVLALAVALYFIYGGH